MIDAHVHLEKGDYSAEDGIITYLNGDICYSQQTKDLQQVIVD